MFVAQPNVAFGKFETMRTVGVTSGLSTTKSFPQGEKAMLGENQLNLVEARLAWRYLSELISILFLRVLCYEAVRVVSPLPTQGCCQTVGRTSCAIQQCE